MIQARIAKRYPAGQESGAFALEMEFQASAGVTVLFGPSGAGKTLTLDCIAGFATPDGGRILLDDVLLFDAAAKVNLPPRRRDCGYVFQNYALFPHMTLRENLLFGAERWARLERHRRVNEMLERFRLADAAGRRPHELSGGEQQRCSIARALIREPRLLLLDEPARGLDAPLRAELYAVLRQVRAEFDIPILLVTHDLEECFELGETMLVVRHGKVVQAGPPRKVVDQPAGVEVARLLGIPNLFPAEIVALDPGRNTSRLRLDEFELAGPYFPGHLRGDRVWLCVRAADLRLAACNSARPGPNQIPVRLVRAAERPQGVRLEFSLGISVEVSREEYEQRKDNKDWIVEFPAQVLRVV
ncbi:MAG TPA: ATP-binding cassette domain-containing protein [Bryobacteraceae bacterium]|nr:ATP-binding cassette domain-containing protein [Bryobacteraceae bacterium]